MNEPLYKQKLITSTQELIGLGKVNELTLKLIATHATIKQKSATSLNLDVEELVHLATIKGITEHKAKSKIILKLGGVDALTTLLRHDIKLIYAIEESRKHMTGSEMYRKSFEYCIDHIENEMPKLYYEILRYNLNLLPDRELNVMHYSHFIVHSLFFFQKRHLEQLTSDHDEKTLIVRQIITSLFKGDQVKLGSSDIITK